MYAWKVKTGNLLRKSEYTDNRDSIFRVNINQYLHYVLVDLVSSIPN